MFKKRIFLIFAFISVGALAVLFFVTPIATILKYRISPNYPKNVNETIKLKGLKDRVNIYFDEYGVPHIEATNVEDLSLATGFVQGRYRFFQLDFLRRFAKGRISELVGDQKMLGSSTVDFDLAMRGWKLEDLANVDIETLPELDQKIVKSFTSGINQALNIYRPPEYDILGIDPIPWAYTDTLVTNLLTAWSLSHNWEQEMVRFALALNLGLERASKIYPHEPLKVNTTLQSSNPKRLLPPGVVSEIKNLFPKSPVKLKNDSKVSYILGDISRIRPSASNAWAVNGGWTKSGSSILSNDMHLSHILPSLCFLQHLKMPELNIIGGTLAGLPFMAGAMNGELAWGMTASVADVIDLIIEKEDPKNPGFVLSESEKCPLISENVEIKIKNDRKFDSKFFTIRKTCRGTIINDMYPNFLPDNAPLVAIRWELPHVQESLSSLFLVNKSKTIDELRKNFMRLSSPIQNVIATDKKGNIAFFSTGSVPIRKEHRGTFPVPGWSDKYSWSGWAGKYEMPFEMNPKNGYLINTNNLIMDPYKNDLLFHIDTAPSFRFDRVEEKIRETDRHTKKTMQDIQNDSKILRGLLVLPHILKDLKTYLKLNEVSETEKIAIELLEKWNFKADPYFSEATIFFTLYRESILLALQEEVSEGVLHLFLNQRYSTNVVDNWFLDPNHVVWDDLNTEAREGRYDIIVHAFKKTIEKLKDDLGNDPKKWLWGKYHYAHPRHPFGGKSILSFMNLPKIGIGGGLDSVWKAHFNLSKVEDTYKVIAGPAYKMIVDMSDINSGRYIIDTGQSGWPLSPHYGDLFNRWKQGKTIPMIYDWKDVQEKSVAHLILE